MNELKQFLRENFIWSKIEGDRRNKCYYIIFYVKDRILTETLYAPFTENKYRDVIKIIKARKKYWEQFPEHEKGDY